MEDDFYKKMELHKYNSIAIVCHSEWKNRQIVENISNFINKNTIVLIKDDKKSQIVRRVMYPKRINIRSVCIDDTSNTDLIIKANPEFSILLSKDTPDENLLCIHDILISNNKKFVIINSNNKIIFKLNDDKFDKSKQNQSDKYLNVNYNKYQQVIDEQYIETFKNTTELVNDMNLRQKSKKKIVKQLKKLHYYETIRNNNMIQINEDKEHKEENNSSPENICASITNKGIRCKNNCVKGSKYCGIKSHQKST